MLQSKMFKVFKSKNVKTLNWLNCIKIKKCWINISLNRIKIIFENENTIRNAIDNKSIDSLESYERSSQGDNELIRDRR